jgi:hypothetical protein
VAGSTLTATGVAGQTFTVTGAGNASNLTSKNVQSGAALASTTGLSLGSSSNGGLASNYNAPGVAGSSYTVTAKGLTLTANDASKVAGQSIALSGYSATGLLGDDSISAISISSLGQPTTATAGSYAIVASSAVGAALSNYNINYQDGTLLVSPAATTPATPITASSQPYISVLASNGQSVLTPAKQQDNEPKALNQNMLVTNPLNVGLNLQVISDGIRLPEGI